MSAPVRHRPVIERGFSETSRTYRMRCTCGVSAEDQAARRMAEIDLREHVQSLPYVPVDQRCRDPKGHDRRYWEPCATCANQLALFD
ncbi:hypothetical protein [Microbispora siamensis]|uniref:Uncharacterized protein n=1 Tax=Microbispora siamensis TaxID=564413 RepID=A0ABQ4GRD2_9ACTN|nr:hypothetical protein [Microbispora siamensis]GIH63991.1 hypothetical protein Msi02_48080 [Microbispora siamensis]